MKTVSIIGPGRVGGAIALALPPARFVIDTLVYRTCAPSGPAGELGAACVPFTGVGPIRSDIVFITTRDGEIASTAEAILPNLRGNIVLHTSGSQSSNILEPLRRNNCKLGSMHPLVSVSAPELGKERFRGSYFCVEGDPEAVAAATEIAESLGGRPFTIDSEFKTLYHAAAVTACGHLVALFDSAVEMMCETGLSADRSKEILLPLVASTVQNLEEQTTAAALTGTFARADTDTFTRHISALNKYGTEELLEIYLLLGERSLELAAKQGVSSQRIETLRSKVAIAKSKLKW